MFHLESSISIWRNQMLATTLSPEVVDELESHLRDEVEGLVHSGADVQLAFESAVQRIGSTAQIKTEFNKMKTSTPPVWPARICHLVLFTFFVGLNMWTGDGLREFSAVYCLLLSLALPLFAGPRPEANARISERWFSTMMAGQVSIGVSAASFMLLHLHPAISLFCAILSCTWFSFQLRRLARAAILES